MTKTYELKTFEDGSKYLEMTDENGQIWGVPMVEGNADYERYLNPEAEHFTPILPNVIDSPTEQTQEGEE
jgi:hypothetical protein